VDSIGNRIPVTKEVQVIMDWHGDVQTDVRASTKAPTDTVVYNISEIKEMENGIELNFRVEVFEKLKELLLKEQHIEMKIPKLNGYDPISVISTTSEVVYIYDDVTGILTVDNNATTDINGDITKNISDTTYLDVKVKYPKEAYDMGTKDEVILEIPVSAYHIGYNNPNVEFENPKMSNISQKMIYVKYLDTETGGIETPDFSIAVGQSVSGYGYVISKTKPLYLYNNPGTRQNGQDRYTVRWGAIIRTQEVDSIIMKENSNTTGDEIVRNDTTKESMSEYLQNIGIYFANATTVLGNSGNIKVYDDSTNMLIHTFTKNDWSVYTASNPYIYGEEIGNIRIETSKVVTNGTLYAYHIKELDDEKIVEKYTETEFNNFAYIDSYLEGTTILNNNSTTIQKSGRANYRASESSATIKSVNPTNITTQETVENIKIQIETTSSNIMEAKWKDGIFLLKFPTEILDVEVTDIAINNFKITLQGYEVYKEGNNLFLKIQTANEIEDIYNITITANVTADSRIASISQNIELYSHNQNNEIYPASKRSEDIYDINGDGNLAHYVGYSTKALDIFAPTGLITAQTISNYNNLGDITVSPGVADINKPDTIGTAQINIIVKSNYDRNISEVKIVGKIPFEGNKSQILEKDLNSTYSARMSNSGIIVPAGIQDKVKVYYSEKEIVTKDLNDSSNGWTTTPSDFSKVKTYLIDLENCELIPEEEHVFNYTVEVSNEIAYNEVAYSTHGVYFYLNTEGGKLADETEVSKVGIKVARKYDIEITKYKKGTSELVKRATYSVTAEGETNSKIGITGENGKTIIKNLYVDKIYTLKEIASPVDYELNTEEVKFIITEDNDKNIQLQVLEGSFVESVIILSGRTDILQIKTENKPKYTLTINKTQQGTDQPLKGITFNIKGKNLPVNGRIYSTNALGQIKMTELYLDEEYTLTETKAKGYYEEGEEIIFKLTRDNVGVLHFNVIQGSFKNNAQIQEIAGVAQPQITVEVQNEKIPTYNLNLTKIEKGKPETKLQGTEFIIRGPGIGNEKIYITNEFGEIDISDLYAYIQGKSMDGIYEIEERRPTEGYALDEKIIKFKVEKDASDNLSIQYLDNQFLENENEIVIDNITKTIYVTFENTPLFKLTKKDGATKEAMPNVKFAIFKVEEDETESVALDINGNAVGELQTINGEQYRIIQTDENGEISIVLQAGLYKIIELETLEGYVLEKYIEDRTYYFGIEKRIQGEKELQQVWENQISGTYGNSNIAITQDDGYVLVGAFHDTITILAEDTVDGQEILLTSNGDIDGLIVKYSKEGKVEYARKVGDINTEYLRNVIGTQDGGYAVVGYYYTATLTIPAEDTANGQAITLINRRDTGEWCDGLIIKYNSEGKVEYARSTRGTGNDLITDIKETQDGGYIVVGYYGGASTMTFPAGETASGQAITLSKAGSFDGLIIKYNSEFKVEYARCVGGSRIDSFISVAETTDGGYAVVGYFESATITIPAGETADGQAITLTNNGGWSDLIIKYNSEGKVEYTRCINSSEDNYLSNIIETQDGGYVVAGYFVTENITIPAGETVDGQEIILTNTENDYPDGIIIKYNSQGKVEYARSVKGENADIISGITKTQDGGFVAVGYFYSETLTISAEDTVKGKEITLANNGAGNYDELVIKYNSEGKVEYAKSIRGTNVDYLYEVVETHEGEYVAIGKGIIKFREITVYSTIQEEVKKEETELRKEWEKIISGASLSRGVAAIDDGYVAIIYFVDAILTISGEETVSGEPIILTNNGDIDGLIIKYNSEGKVEYAKNIGSAGNDYIIGVSRTQDGGYVVSGAFYGNTLTIPAEDTVSGQAITLTNARNGYADGLVIKYSNDGKVEYAKSIKGTGNINPYSIAGTSDGGCITAGWFTNEDITIPEEETANGQVIMLTNKGDRDVLAVKYNSEGKVEYARSIGSTNLEYISGVAETTDGGYIAVGAFEGATLTIPVEETVSSEPIILTNNGDINGLIIKYNSELKVEYAKSVGGIADDLLYEVAEMTDGGYITAGAFKSATLTIPVEETVSGQAIILTNNGGYDGLVIKYNSEGKVEYAKSVGGIADDLLYGITEMTNGGCVAVGPFASATITIPAEETVSGQEITLTNNVSYDGLIIKYNNEGKVEYAKGIGNTETIRLDDVTSTEDGEIIVAGGYNNNTAAYIAKFKEIPPQKIETSEIEVLNYKKQYRITTEVQGEGGTVSGHKQSPYETVVHKENSIKDLIITPNTGYIVSNITVNGEDIAYISESDGTVILNKFESVTEDKHIVVSFESGIGEVVVHHYIYENNTITTTQLSEDVTLTGKFADGLQVAENYYTTPDVYLLDEYRVVEELLPSNSSGVFTQAKQEVIYYYELLPYNLIVHHYLEGTKTKLTEDEIYEKTKGEQYITQSSSSIDYSKYELVAEPSNKEGTMDTNPTEVEYYYRVKDAGQVIVHHYIKNTDTKLVEDEILPVEGDSKKVGDTYRTAPSIKVPANYSVIDAQPANYEGQYIEGIIEVIYYYEMIESSVVNNNIEKDGTDRIISLDEAVSYEINYKSTIDDYIGAATIKVVDYLPEAIDITKSNLSGGTYDDQEKTITWEIYETGIDTFVNGEKEITFTKDISVVYIGLTGNEGTITNKVEAETIIYAPEKRSGIAEDMKDTEIKTPELTIEKELFPGQRNPVIPEETVTYTITVTNTGDVELNNIEVRDSLDNTWIQTIIKLEPGESEEYIFEYIVPINTPNGTTLKNVVTAVCDELEEPETDEEDIEVRTPGLEITKELAQGQRNPVLPGETVTYTIIVTNTGDIELNNIEVTDSLDNTWTRTITKLEPNESEEYSFEYTVPINTPNSTAIKNIVTAVCDEISEPETDEEDILVYTPDLTITKQLAVGQKNPVMPGETVTYKITVTNTGNIELNNIEVTDSLDDTWTQTIIKLEPGESEEYTFEYIVANNTPNNTTMKNIVTASCNELDDPETDEEDILVKTPGLNVIKELAAGQRNPVMPGETVAYTITVSNTGNIELTNVVVTDSLDLSWTQTITKLFAGESKEYTFEYIVPLDTPNNTTIKNVVTAACDELPEPDEDEEDILVYIPELTIEKELAAGQRNPVLPGETVAYTITVSNTGNIELTNVEITDSLDLSWTQTITKLFAGESKEYTFEYIVPNDTPNNTTIKNVVTASCDELDDPEEEDVDIEVRTPNISISKELAVGQRNPVIPGETVAYKITVLNTGEIELNNIEVTDSLDNTWVETITKLNPGESKEYTFEYIVPNDTPNGTIITNVATVVSDEIKDPKEDDVDIEVRTPEISISKELAVGQRNPVMPGETVTYTIIVENTGNIELNNVIVTDSLDSNWTQTITVLEIGESKEYTFEYIVPINTPNNTTITNVVTVVCDEIKDPKEDEEDVTVKIPGLNVTKELANGQRNPVLPGETVIYTITVTNIREIELTNVEITDSLDLSWTKTITKLNPGESKEYTFEYIVPIDTLNGTIITNVATAVCDEIKDPKEDEEDIEVKTPEISISKKLAEDQENLVIPGEVVIYKIVVENTGNIDLHNVVVKDSLDDTWIQIIDELKEGESEEFEFEYIVPMDTMNNDTIINKATAVSDETPEPKEDEEEVIVKEPDYTIMKTLAPGQNRLVLPGEEVRYVITVLNTGEIELNNIIITDSLDNTWIKEVEKLEIGESVEYEFIYQVPIDIEYDEVITNIAKVKCDELEEITAEEEIIVKEPVLIVRKELAEDQDRIVYPGETVRYKIVVENVGERDLHNIEVRDILDDKWEETISVLPIGESEEYEFEYIVLESAEKGEIIINIVIVKCDELEEITDEEEVLVNEKVPDVKITKEIREDQKIPILPGEEITYVITVENIGEVDLTNVEITDSLDENWVQEIEKLEIGKEVKYEFVYKVPQDAKNNEEIVNIARVVCEELEEEKEADVMAEIKVPSYKITKELAEDQSEIVLPGETVKYRITVENTGEVNLTNVIITDSLDEGGVWTKKIDILKHSEFNIAYYTFEYTVPESATEGEIITNIARVECDQLEKKEDEEEITISENPVLELTIEKELASGQSETVAPGEVVTYEITVTNTGTENLNNVIVTDIMDKNWIQEIEVLEKSESKTYEFIYIVPANAKDGEAITNIAAARCDELEEQKDETEIEVKTNNQNNNNNNTTPPPSGNNTPNTSQSNNNNTVVYNNTIVYNNTVVYNNVTYIDRQNQSTDNYISNVKTDNPYTGDINMIRIIIMSISAITIIIVCVKKLRTKNVNK